MTDSDTTPRSPLPAPRSQEEHPPTPPHGGDAFARFFQAYPRQTNEKAARRAWDRINPDAGLVAEILAAVEAQKGSDQWRRGVYPHASTWLNKERWKDKVPANGRASEPRASKEEWLAQKARENES